MTGGGEANPLLDRYMPRWEKREYHERAVHAPAARAYAALRGVELGRSSLIRGIFFARSVLMGAGREPLPRAPFVDHAVSIGWRILEERPGEAVAVGAVTQPWVANVTFRGLAPEEFVAFEEPGFAKILWGVGARPASAASSTSRRQTPRSTMWTETRVALTDEQSRRRFAKYWLAFGTGIRLIRRVALGLAATDAER